MRPGMDHIPTFSNIYKRESTIHCGLGRVVDRNVKGKDKLGRFNCNDPHCQTYEAGSIAVSPAFDIEKMVG